MSKLQTAPPPVKWAGKEPGKATSGTPAGNSPAGMPPGTVQNALAFSVPVKPESVDQLDQLLLQLRTEIEQGRNTPFEALGTIHYLRLVLLPPEEGNPTSSTRLVFATDYDGDEATQIQGLVSICAAFMDSIFEHCEGYPAPAGRSPESRKAYLLPFRLKPAAFFAGAPGRTLQQIRQESELRNYIWNFVREGSWEGKTAVQIHKAVRAEVLSRPEFQWANTRAPLPNIHLLRLAIMGICVLALVPFLIVWILILQWAHERKDKQLGLTPSQVDGKHTRKLEEYEDWHNQNQFTQLLVMKPGSARLKTVQGMMLLTRILGGSFFVHGKLMGIPTIHFARWQMIDQNRRMLFFSNFDGSWQQYLGDFIDKSGWGLTGIWSNTKNFPRARFLFTGGAYDAEHFLAWSRYYQIPTAVWYCAYPNLSIKNVMSNTYIRNAMVQDFTEVKAQQFLNRL